MGFGYVFPGAYAPGYRLPSLRDYKNALLQNLRIGLVNGQHTLRTLPPIAVAGVGNVVQLGSIVPIQSLHWMRRAGRDVSGVLFFL